MMKLRAVNQTGGEDIVAGYEPEGDMVEAKYEKLVHQLMVKQQSETKENLVCIRAM